MDDDALAVLRREFDAEEGSFLLGLRGRLEWDRDAFRRLERAMRAACVRQQGREVFERWLAEGFYEVSHFVPDWTGHPNFPRPQPREYYEDCLERVADLADWFFRGEHAYQEPHEWPEL
ncbi:hypothetical protein AB0J86_07720 [Micromonospora sp. NPDC049559]|uniref:hypothetical protein n=1 Tax=Micromonospora sp. NPDC049559 TaxID=3155923 RepID=UPI0034377670